MIFAIFFLVSVCALILHFTGHLERWGMEWVLIVLAVAIFPVVIYF